MKEKDSILEVTGGEIICMVIERAKKQKEKIAEIYK